MKQTKIISVLLFISLCFQSLAQDDFLIKIVNEKEQCGYVNSEGDTIVPFGKYFGCFTDTIISLGKVYSFETGAVGIDIKGKELFEVFWFDNGPDYVEEGLFRIVENEQIGYANEEGEIIIKPQFACAFPFKNGKAKVSNSCHTELHGEHSAWISDDWFYIDHSGNRIEE